MDCSPPGSSVCGIFQARILEWVATSYFGGSSELAYPFFFFFKIISQYICISNHYIVHLKLTKCYISVLSPKHARKFLKLSDVIEIAIIFKMGHYAIAALCVEHI